MAHKKKPGKASKKKGAEEEAADRANAIDDIYPEDFKKSLRIETRELEKQIKKEEDLIGLYNDERLRVNYFWLVGKKELEDKQAELRNK